MPNLQELLPFYQQLFQQWSELTLINAPYAITLGLSVWLVTAIGYSISIGVVKMRLAREVKASSELQASLDTAQQRLQTAETELAASTQQLEQANQQLEIKSQLANNLEQKLLGTNKKLSEGIAVLVEKFELIDNAPAQQADAEALWQRYSAIIGRVGERFQSEQQVKARLQLDVQAEKSKLADKDASIANLQGRLDSQTQKIVELELAASQQQSQQQELETFKQRLLIAQDKHRSDSARILELEKTAGRGSVQSAAPAVVAAEPAVRQPVVSPVLDAPDQVAAVAAAPVAVQQTAAEVAVEAVVKQAAPSKAAGKLKGLFGNAMEKFSKFDEKIGSPTAPKPAIAEEVAAPAAVAEQVIETSIVVEPEQPIVKLPAANVTSPAAGFANKLGGMLGGLKKSPAKPVVELVTEPEPAAAIVEIEVEQAPQVAEIKDGGKKPGKLGGLLGRFKK